VPLTEDARLMALELIAAGLGLGIGAPLTLAWVSEISPAGTRAMAFSLRLAANRVGQALLPIGIGAVVAGIGASGVFWATAGTLGISALLCARYFQLQRRR
jgi:MFS family permease